jgi:hypothetical protein
MTPDKLKELAEWHTSAAAVSSMRKDIKFHTGAAALLTALAEEMEKDMNRLRRKRP